MYKLAENGVVRLSDSALIPLTEENRDYRFYLEWLAAGNEPEPQYTEAELAALAYAEGHVREIVWRDAQLVDVADQLLKIEDDDPTAFSTPANWRAYRVQLRAWTEGAVHYPDIAHRPVRPVGD
ncbi:hypothetical protein Villemi_00042 [Pseudomonas phage vB_PpuP-Villemi]